MSHATDNLEEIVSRAEEMGFTHYCLTEHMPRLHERFLYPEEEEKAYTCKNLQEDFENYLVHAKAVQLKYREKKSPLKVLIGFEVEGLDTEHIEYTKRLWKEHSSVINMCVGSTHYVHETPIDFSAELWLKAMSLSSGQSARSLFLDYFDLQFEVLASLNPTVVGHFDLIRLFEPSLSTDPTTGKLIKDIDIETDWPEVWDLIIRNIKYVALYGGLFELNSAAIRKGWESPYPKRDIAEAIKKYADGRFCLSDDSHSIKQVGLNYHKVWDYVANQLQLEWIYYLDLDEVLGKTIVAKKSVKELTQSMFWNNYKQ